MQVSIVYIPAVYYPDDELVLDVELELVLEVELEPVLELDVLLELLSVESSFQLNVTELVHDDEDNVEEHEGSVRKPFSSILPLSYTRMVRVEVSSSLVAVTVNSVIDSLGRVAIIAPSPPSG